MKAIDPQLLDAVLLLAECDELPAQEIPAPECVATPVRSPRGGPPGGAAAPPGAGAGAGGRRPAEGGGTCKRPRLAPAADLVEVVVLDDPTESKEAAAAPGAAAPAALRLQEKDKAAVTAPPAPAPTAPAPPPSRVVLPRGTSFERALSQEAFNEAVLQLRDAVPPALEPQLPPQVLRISAGRAAVAAGLHPFADIGELFLELLYQDMPEQMLREAALVGVELVSPVAERARLIEKSGEASQLDAAMQAAHAAPGIEGAQVAREEIARVVLLAKEAARLTEEEAAQLQELLQKEVYHEFGARHEDAALDSYAARVGQAVHSQQRRVLLPLPRGGPAAALATAFPDPAAVGSGAAGEGEPKKVEPYMMLSGYVDAMVDLPLQAEPTAAAAVAADERVEKLVVEVKHRMGKIKDPPQIYDVIQLCSYCRALGCTRGDLVQCLREGGASVLHVTRIDFAEGTRDRRGWDEHVLPALYSTAEAVYAARRDLPTRCRLLAAVAGAGAAAGGGGADGAPPTALRELVSQLCPHLG